jgi:aspartyl-tRNA(Asn)/glutamyl-tRNA(Gln) amidotransferase subunit C
MARVGVETVRHVARLAHLSLTREEEETFARQLDEVLGYAESIQLLDVGDVLPTSDVRPPGLLREDEPQDGLSRERALEAAPDVDAGLFRVPRILGG